MKKIIRLCSAVLTASIILQIYCVVSAKNTGIEHISIYPEKRAGISAYNFPFSSFRYSMMLRPDCFAGGIWSHAWDADRYIANNSEIPVVRLEGVTDGMNKDTEKTLRFTYEKKGKTKEGYALVSYQGSSSLAFNKKNYSVKLFKDEGHTDKMKMGFGKWDKSHKFVLKANWIDYTNARNIVGGRLYSKMPFTDLPNGHKGVIYGFPVNLYINDKYMGVYTVNQPKTKNVFGLKDEDAQNGAMLYCAEIPESPEATGSNYAAGDRWDRKFPDEADDAALERMVSFVENSNYREFKAYAQDYLDIESLVNYFVYSTICLNGDGLHKNYNMVTFDGKVWYIRPYDLDATYGLNFDGKVDTMKYTDNLSYWMHTLKLWNKLEVCYPRRIYRRYVEVRNNQLSEENIINEFAKYMREIGMNNYSREFTRWNERPSKYAGLQQISDFIYERYAYLDTYMKEQYDKESLIVDPPDM